MTPARPNPCRSVRHYRERSCERFLTEEEYARLGRLLFEAESEGSSMASAVAAVRRRRLTGCRKNEILMLRWDDIDRTAGELRLRDAKSGPRQVPLTPAVKRVLARIPPGDRQALGPDRNRPAFPHHPGKSDDRSKREKSST